jgi:hypothetical protein
MKQPYSTRRTPCPLPPPRLLKIVLPTAGEAGERPAVSRLGECVTYYVAAGVHIAIQYLDRALGVSGGHEFGRWREDGDVFDTRVAIRGPFSTRRASSRERADVGERFPRAFVRVVIEHGIPVDSTPSVPVFEFLNPAVSVPRLAAA